MSRLKVAVDISPIYSAHKYRGIGAYTQSLAESLKRHQSDNFQIELVKKGKIPRDTDLIHYPYFDFFFLTLPLKKPKKTVVTIHDVIPLVSPGHYPPGLKGRVRFLIQKLSLQGTPAVITDSENSKKDIVKYLAYPKEKIYVVPLAPRGIFKPITDRKTLSSIGKKYKLPDKFVLYVGDVSYNKNVPGLVRACQKIKIPLVIVGKQATQKDFDRSHPENRDLVWLEKHKKSLILTGFIPDGELVKVYNLATLYCQPSFYEGFGLPVLEAMACGCPVVAANTSSLPEICGDAALMVDPKDYNDIARGVKKVLEEKSLRRRLVKNGLAQAKKFSWEKTARETLKVYEKVVRV